jgi:hypothetical protein
MSYIVECLSKFSRVIVLSSCCCVVCSCGCCLVWVDVDLMLSSCCWPCVIVSSVGCVLLSVVILVSFVTCVFLWCWLSSCVIALLCGCESLNASELYRVRSSYVSSCSLATVWSECLKVELLSLFQYQWLCAPLCPWLCRCFRKRSVVCVSCCCCCWLILIVRWWMLSKFNLIIVECVFEVVMWVLWLNLWSCALCWCCGVCARGWHWDGVIEVLSRLDWVVHWDDMLRLRD